MSYTIAGIDVHKKVLVVVVAEVTEQGEWNYERGKFGATAYHGRRSPAESSAKCDSAAILREYWLYVMVTGC